MPEFQFLATLTVNAPSEAAAQTQADHAIEDADQYLSDDYRLERGLSLSERAVERQGMASRGNAFLGSLSSLGPRQSPRYTVELTTEGWQIKDNVRGFTLADVYNSQSNAETYAGIWNDHDKDEGEGRH